MAARSASGRSGAGASSTSFWCRRCNRAIPVEQMPDLAMVIAEDLHLDMTGGIDKALEQNMVVAESGPGLALREGERLREACRIIDPAHAASATAGARLDHQRIADPLRLAREQRRVLLRPPHSLGRPAGRPRPPPPCLASCCPSG